MTRHVRDRAVRRRDAAIRRLRRAKQALTALSLLFAGIIGTAAARAFPGRSSHHAAPVARSVSDTAPAHSSGASHATAAHGHRSIRHGSTGHPARVRVHLHHRHPTGHRAGAAAQTTTSSSTAAAATTPAATTPATTPAPAPSTSAAVTSGGS